MTTRLTFWLFLDAAHIFSESVTNCESSILWTENSWLQIGHVAFTYSLTINAGPRGVSNRHTNTNISHVDGKWDGKLISCTPRERKHSIETKRPGLCALVDQSYTFQTKWNPNTTCSDLKSEHDRVRIWNPNTISLWRDAKVKMKFELERVQISN